jgi:hypothetical protein
MVSVATVEISMGVLQKLKIKLSYDPAIPLLDIYLKKSKSVYNRETCTPMLIVALLVIEKYGISLGARIDPRTLHTLGEHSTTELHPQPVLISSGLFSCL